MCHVLKLPTIQEAGDMAWVMETLVVKGFDAWLLQLRLVLHVLGLSFVAQRTLGT